MTAQHQYIPVDAKIYVAGHRGMVGGAIIRSLHQQGQTNIVTRTAKTSPSPNSRRLSARQ